MSEDVLAAIVVRARNEQVRRDDVELQAIDAGRVTAERLAAMMVHEPSLRHHMSDAWTWQQDFTPCERARATHLALCTALQLLRDRGVKVTSRVENGRTILHCKSKL